MSSDYKRIMDKLQAAVDKANERYGHEVYKIDTFAGKTEVMNIRNCESAPASTLAEATSVLAYMEYYITTIGESHA